MSSIMINSIPLKKRDLYDDEEIEACIEEVMTVNEEVDLEDLSLIKPTLELKPLPSSLKYAFYDTQQENSIIILS